jgi:hypothetical protein
MRQFFRCYLSYRNGSEERRWPISRVITIFPNSPQRQKFLAVLRPGLHGYERHSGKIGTRSANLVPIFDGCRRKWWEKGRVDSTAQKPHGPIGRLAFPGKAHPPNQGRYREERERPLLLFGGRSVLVGAALY